MQRIFLLGILINLGLVASAAAQIPGVPAAPAVPAAPVAPAVAGAPAAPQSNLWSYLCCTPDQIAACKACFCQSAVGQMATSAMGPVSLMSGGLLQGCCPASAISQDLLKPADSAEGAAARIKADEADVAARRAAIRYLGTVDCNRWPEAGQALADALLFDRSECVRLEAALALQRGCCCTKLTVKALTDCITGNVKPVETSERVKCAAVVALSHCAIPEEIVEEKERKKDEPLLKKAELNPADYYKRVQEKSRAEVMVEARKALADVRTDTTSGSAAISSAPARPGTVLQIVTNAFSPGSAPRANEALQVAAQNAASKAQTAQPAQAAPAGSVATAANTGERKPFFDNLTRALKGKQSGPGDTFNGTTAMPATASMPSMPTVVTMPTALTTMPAVTTMVAMPTAPAPMPTYNTMVPMPTAPAAMPAIPTMVTMPTAPSTLPAPMPATLPPPAPSGLMPTSGLSQTKAAVADGYSICVFSIDPTVTGAPPNAGPSNNVRQVPPGQTSQVTPTSLLLTPSSGSYYGSGSR